MKQYLELVNANNKAIFIDANSITAISDSSANKGTHVYCSGMNEPFLIKISHFDLIKKLVEIKSFELVKFG